MMRLPRKIFVSHASSEREAIARLREVLPASCELDVFFDPSWDPRTPVSAEIVRRIHRADAVIVMDSQHAKSRQWVFFETQYALLAKKSLYHFDFETQTLRRDRSRPLDLKVFPSYSRRDQARLAPLLEMFAERFFDTWDDQALEPGIEIAEAITKAMSSRLAAGGYCLLFCSRASLESLWVERETAFVLQRYPSQVLPVLMDEVQLPAPVAHIQTFRWLPGEEKSLEWLADELVILLYALIGTYQAPRCT